MGSGTRDHQTLMRTFEGPGTLEFTPINCIRYTAVLASLSDTEYKVSGFMSSFNLLPPPADRMSCQANPNPRLPPSRSKSPVPQR